MTVDEAILKAIALLQQAPSPRGPHIDSAISILEDTQVTPTASSRLVEEALAPVQAALIQANEAAAALRLEVADLEAALEEATNA